MTSPGPVRQGEPARLLFVVGERETQQVLERLRGAGLDVSAERVDTLEALRAALEQPWDVVVSGAELPGLGFRAVAPLLREKDPELAFLVLTSRWDEAEMSAALAAGTRGYLDMGRLAQVVLEVQREVRRAVERRQHQRAEAERQSRSEFLADLNHDIRSPLNGIIGHCDLLMLEEGSLLTPNGQRDLRMVKKNAQALLSLINDVLALFKLDAGRMEMEQELVNFRDLAEECVCTVRETLEGRGLELTYQVAEQVFLLRTDELKLRQMLLSLLLHAANSIPSGRIVFTARAEGHDALFLVEEMGGEISEDSAVETPRRTGAIALELVLARELAQVLGGSLSVRGAAGQDTTFVVRLPCLVEDAAS